MCHFIVPKHWAKAKLDMAVAAGWQANISIAKILFSAQKYFTAGFKCIEYYSAVREYLQHLPVIPNYTQSFIHAIISHIDEQKLPAQLWLKMVYYKFCPSAICRAVAVWPLTYFCHFAQLKLIVIIAAALFLYV